MLKKEREREREILNNLINRITTIQMNLQINFGYKFC